MCIEEHFCKDINHESYFCTCLVPPISVIVSPANPDVSAGDNVTIVCTVNSSIPVSQFLWNLNGRFLPLNAMVSVKLRTFDCSYLVFAFMLY